MTTPIDTQSRRSILAAAIGGVGALLAAAIQPQHGARAASGDPILVDQTTNGSGITTLQGSSFTSDGGLTGVHQVVNGVGVTGIGAGTGVSAYSDSGNALVADVGIGAAKTVLALNHRLNGFAIDAQMTNHGVGVRGQNLSGELDADSCGVWGEGGLRGVQGTAVFGGLGVAGLVQDAGPNGYGSPRIQNGPGSAGVFGASIMPGASTVGVAGRATNGNGVVGLSDLATGVQGVSGPGWPTAVGAVGVHGYDSGSGRGVWGHSPAGSGVYCTSASGNALRVNGKARFSRAGKANIPANKKYVDVTVPGGIASSTIVLASLQTYRSGVGIAAVRPNYPQSGKARIYLTKVASTTAATAVGWLAAEYGA